ncbi:MAG: glycosyltransferase family 4 protein [Candidatus Eisenbacteria bacterium]
MVRANSPGERSGLGAPLILHIEAGPTFGGSTLALQNYLEHADPSRFTHDVLFHADVPGTREIRARSRRFLCLRLAAPADWDRTAAEMEETAGPPSRLRRAAKQIPGARSLVRAGRGAARFAGRELPLAVRLARIFTQGRYDLIHCNNTFVVQPSTILAAWLTRTPLVSHVRTRVALGTRERRLGNRSRRVLAVSRSLAEDLARQGLRSPITVCYEGIPLAPRTGMSASRKRELSGTSGPVLGFAGRLVERKGVAHLLAAMPRILSRHPEATLLIAGEGPLRAALDQSCAALDLGRNVRFLGFRDDVPDLMGALDLFVLPSLTEGLPLVLLEAMAAARPIVASGVDGVPEFIHHEQTGLLVPPAAAEDLADAVLRVLEDPALAARLGQAARAYVAQHGDARETSRALDAAFLSALEARGAAAGPEPAES